MKIMNNKNKKNRLTSIPATFAIVSVLIVIIIIITSSSDVLTEVIGQSQAQTLNVTEQKMHVTDVNVHFKTACISIIIFTYCW